MKPLFDAPWGNYLLKEFVETQAPESVSWFPQTIAWKILFVCFLVWSARKVWLKVKAYKANAYRREALSWLANLPEFNSTKPDSQYRQLPALIKTTALFYFQRKEVNNIHFSDWDTWLDSHCTKTDFTHKCPQLLTHISYREHISIGQQDMHTLVEQIKIWIIHHGDSND